MYVVSLLHQGRCTKSRYVFCFHYALDTYRVAFITCQVNKDSVEVPPNLPGPFKPQRAVLYEDLGASDVERTSNCHVYHDEINQRWHRDPQITFLSRK